MSTPESAALFDTSVPLAGISADDLDATIDHRAEAMEQAAVEVGVLVADRRGPEWHPDAVFVDRRHVAAAIERHPGTFLGAVGVDPTRGLSELKQIREAVDEGFVAAHAVPHAFGLAPDDKSWYPIYATCVELDIPIQIELGIRVSPGTRVRSVGRPISLDAVACDFPDLKIVGLGPWPWVEEAISMAYKHPGVHLAIGGDDPGGIDPSFTRFADSWGRGKVMFASGGSPVPEAVARLSALDLRPPALRGLRETADRVLRASP
jgi:predicted TIM-barrel fold metal-dependent hydrolase